MVNSWTCEVAFLWAKNSPATCTWVLLPRTPSSCFMLFGKHWVTSTPGFSTMMNLSQMKKSRILTTTQSVYSQSKSWTNWTTKEMRPKDWTELIWCSLGSASKIELSSNPMTHSHRRLQSDAILRPSDLENLVQALSYGKKIKISSWNLTAWIELKITGNSRAFTVWRTHSSAFVL